MAAMLGSVYSLECLGAIEDRGRTETPTAGVSLSAKKAAKEYNKEH